jgi:hypothetical protein
MRSYWLYAVGFTAATANQPSPPLASLTNQSPLANQSSTDYFELQVTSYWMHAVLPT